MSVIFMMLNKIMRIFKSSRHYVPALASSILALLSLLPSSLCFSLPHKSSSGCYFHTTSCHCTIGPQRSPTAAMASASSSSSLDAAANTATGAMLGGLTFLKTNDRQQMVEFYTTRLGMKVWLEQPDISILSHGNLLLGFHEIRGDNTTTRTTMPDTQGVYTLVYPTTAAVDAMYQRLADVAVAPPQHNTRYRIYNFFAQDPEGRTLECQVFLHPVSTVTSDPATTTTTS